MSTSFKSRRSAGRRTKPPPAVTNTARALASVTLLHLLVDGYAILIEPLWPRFGETYRLTSPSIAVLMVLWSLTTSGSQVLFGYLGDRVATQSLLIWGPMLAVLSISAIGVAPSATVLFLLVVLAGIGIGSFHPQGAVTAAGVEPENRNRGLSVFMCGGTLGLGVGPVISGHLTHYFGAQSLLWLAIPGTAAILAVAWWDRALLRKRSAAKGIEDAAGNGQPTSPSPSHAPRPGLASVFRGRRRTTLLLLVVSVARVVPIIGINRALAYTLKARGGGEHIIGTLQGVFLLAGGIGMLLSAVWMRRDWEKAAMVLSPFVGVPLLLLAAVPDGSIAVLTLLLAAAGLVLSGTTPSLVSYAHELLPGGRGLASSLTMGLSWAFAGAIVAGLVTYFDSAGNPQMAIASFSPFLAVSGLAAIWLPRMPHLRGRPLGDATADPAHSLAG